MRLTHLKTIWLNILLLISAFAFNSHARNPRLTGEEFQELNGVIYSVVSKGQPRDFKFGEWITGKITNLDTVFFNANGLVDRIVDADYAGPSRCGLLQFAYSADGRLDRISGCGSFYQFFYNNGKLVKVDKKDSGNESLEGRETWSYNPQGFVYTVYDFMGDIEDVHTYNGSKLTKKSISGEFTVDGKHRPVEYKDANNTYKYLETWTYNNNGDITSYTSQRWIKGRNGWEEIPAALVKETFEYEYDDHKNWVRKIATRKTFAPDRSESYIYLRDFVYFDSLDSLSFHIDSINNAIIKAQKDAENARIAAEQRKAQQEELRRQAEIQEREERELNRLNRLKDIVGSLLSQGLFASERKEAYKLTIREREWRNCLTGNFELTDDSYRITASDGRLYGPYVFDGLSFDLKVDISDKKGLNEFGVPFNVIFNQDKTAAIATYNKHQIILTINELRHMDRLILLKK